MVLYVPVKDLAGLFSVAVIEMIFLVGLILGLISMYIRRRTSMVMVTSPPWRPRADDTMSCVSLSSHGMGWHGGGVLVL